MMEMEVARQATMLAYVQDFQFMAISIMGAFPLLLLLRAPDRPLK